MGARLHARIAQTLEETYGDDAEAHAAELAHHFAEAEAVLGTQKLVRYSLPAGERALAAFAWEEALAHFQRDLATRDGQPMDDQKAELLFGLGRAQTGTFTRRQLGEALVSLNRAFDYYADAGDVSRALAVALCPVRVMIEATYQVDQRIVLALTLVPGESIAAGRLQSFYGEQLARYEGDYEGAQEAFNRALTIAQSQGDLNLEMQTLAASTSVDYDYLRNLECVEKSMRVIELAHRVNDLEPQSTALGNVVMLHYEVGDFSKGEAYLEQLLEVMRESTPVPGAVYGFPAWVIPWVAQITGVMERTEIAVWAAAAVLSFPTCEPIFAIVAKAGLGLLAVLSHTIGNLDQAVAHFDDAQAFCRKAGYRPELARSLCDYADTLLQRNEHGDRERASSLLDESLAISSELGLRPLMEQVLSRRDILKA